MRLAGIATSKASRRQLICAAPRPRKRPRRQRSFYREAVKKKNPPRSHYQLVLLWRVLPSRRKLAPPPLSEPSLCLRSTGTIARPPVNAITPPLPRLLAAGSRATPKALRVAVALIRTARFDLDAGRLPESHPRAKGEIVASPRASARSRSRPISSWPDAPRPAPLQVLLAASTARSTPLARATVPARLRAEPPSQGHSSVASGRVQERGAHADAIAVFRHVARRRLEPAQELPFVRLFFLSRFEDAIALVLEATASIWPSGGLFQIARTLANIAAPRQSRRLPPRPLFTWAAPAKPPALRLSRRRAETLRPPPRSRLETENRTAVN